MDRTWSYRVSRFRDRRDAGRQLAERLRDYRGRPNVLVLALPRGGVPVGFEVARALEAPLDVLIVRKLGLPGHEELAMGAIASGGVRVQNPEVVRPLRIPEQLIDQIAARERLELERREQLYRGGRSGHDPAGRDVVFACRSGRRSVTASLAAQEQGFPYSSHLAGGILAWKAAGLPTET